MRNRIKERLAERSMTQWELAVASGIRETTLNTIINGRRCNLTTAQAIAGALDTTVDDLWPIEREANA